MKIFTSLAFVLFSLIIFTPALANNAPPEKANDSLTLGQAFINLSLAGEYFDTINATRLEKILRFEEKQLNSITDSSFIDKNRNLYHFTYSLWYLGKARQLYANKKDTSRNALLIWKSTLSNAISHFNNAGIDQIKPSIHYNPYYEFIGFTDLSCIQLKYDLVDLKERFTSYFNNDIYPDFKRVFLAEKKTKQFSFDSLAKYTALYDITLRSNILDLASGHRTWNIGNSPPWLFVIDEAYRLDLALDLISRYLQLNFIANNFDSLCIIDELKMEFDSFREQLNPESAVLFNNYYEAFNKIQKDEFFRTNLDSSVCTQLYNKLKKINKPDDCNEDNYTAVPGYGRDDDLPAKKYFFPIPAPFPSDYRYIPHFKPTLTKMNQVDNHLKSIFDNAGYKGHTQYYYVKSGYAMTTSLEAINKEGAPMNQGKRWNVTVAGNGKFSLYEVFKSIFFATESEFRIFALVISPKEVEIQSSPTTIGAMQDLLINSYPSLPEELENLELPEKVLTILVYNFHQNDIGEVPMLDTSKRLSVADHLSKSGLAGLLHNQ